MAGPIRLFQKTEDGLLMQIAPDLADAAREGRMVSRMSLEIDVLWTAEEQAAHEAEIAAAAKAREAREKERQDAIAAREANVAAAKAKLDAVGLSADDLRALLLG